MKQFIFLFILFSTVSGSSNAPSLLTENEELYTFGELIERQEVALIDPRTNCEGQYNTMMINHGSSGVKDGTKETFMRFCIYIETQQNRLILQSGGNW